MSQCSTRTAIRSQISLSPSPPPSPPRPKPPPPPAEDVSAFVISDEEVETFIDICGDGSVRKKITTPGEIGGDSPPTGAGVVCHYTGRLMDGSKFDSSHDRGSPFDFKIGSGTRRRTSAPPALAFRGNCQSLTASGRQV